MYKCPHCTINLSLRQFKCPRCLNYYWRLPHIVIGAVLLLLTVTGAIFLADYLAVNQVLTPPQQDSIILQSAPSAGGYQRSSQPLRRSNPGQPRPANKRH